MKSTYTALNGATVTADFESWQVTYEITGTPEQVAAEIAKICDYYPKQGYGTCVEKNDGTRALITRQPSCD